MSPSSPSSICHVIVDLDVGGAEIMLKRVLEADPAAAGGSVVISLTSLGTLGEGLRARGIRVHTLEMSSALDFPLALLRLLRLFRHHRPQVVQTWMYHADLMGGLAARLAGNRNIVWGIRRTSLVHSDPAQTILVMKICAWLSRWVPKKIVCVAEAARQAHIQAGYDGSRMLVIPNGFDFSHYDVSAEQRLTLRRDCRLSDHDLVVGCVGRFHEDKGQGNFLKAAEITLRSHTNLKFLLVGRGCDPSNAILMRWLRDLGVEDRFVLLGERDDVPVCLSAMDVFCMPSRTEGFPNSLGEAMAMALPCVATRVGDVAVLGGEAIILVPPENEAALARGLLEVIALSKDARSQMGQRAKVRVMEEFSLDKTVARFRAVYDEVDSGVNG